LSYIFNIRQRHEINGFHKIWLDKYESFAVLLAGKRVTIALQKTRFRFMLWGDGRVPQ
jgi:hypothetical protein